MTLSDWIKTWLQVICCTHACFGMKWKGVTEWRCDSVESIVISRFRSLIPAASFRKQEARVVTSNDFCIQNSGVGSLKKGCHQLPNALYFLFSFNLNSHAIQLLIIINSLDALDVLNLCEVQVGGGQNLLLEKMYVLSIYEGL